METIKTGRGYGGETVIGGERLADGTAMMPVSSVQKKFRDCFGGAAVNSQKWAVSTSGGMTATVASSQLTIATGTTNGATASLLSTETFTIPVRVMVCCSLSQRIANQDFFIELVSVDPATGLPDGLNCMSWRLNGTTATQGIYRVQSEGSAVLDSSAQTITTTAAAAILELEAFADEAYFHSRAVDSSAGRSNSYVRHTQIPDPGALYKLQIRAVNTGVAASNTNMIVQFASVTDYAELTAEITAGRGSNVAGQGLAVNVIGTVPVSMAAGVLAAGTAAVGDVGSQYRANATGAASKAHLVSAASTNLTNIKASAGRLLGWCLANTSAAWKYVKIHNVAGAPTAGASVYMTIAIPPNGISTMMLEGGVAMSTGIAYSTVTGAADTDTTAVALNDIVGDIFFA